MIRITLEGPIGAGKTRIVMKLRDYLDEMGMTSMLEQESTKAAIAKYKPDVLIIEKVNNALPR